MRTRPCGISVASSSPATSASIPGCPLAPIPACPPAHRRRELLACHARTIAAAPAPTARASSD
eukprot:scaffold257_cov76-Isochrysis_galbana.AAC.4